MHKEKKKLTTFKIEKQVRDMAESAIKIRAYFRKDNTIQNFSSYLRTLITEDFSRQQEKIISIIESNKKSRAK
jgi:hypothetical protein